MSINSRTEENKINRVNTFISEFPEGFHIFCGVDFTEDLYHSLIMWSWPLGWNNICKSYKHFEGTSYNRGVYIVYFEEGEVKNYFESRWGFTTGHLRGKYTPEIDVDTLKRIIGYEK